MDSPVMTVRTQRDRTPAVTGDAEEALGGGGVGVLAPQERGAGVTGQVADLAGRDPRGAGRHPQVVLAADDLPLLAAGEAEGREGGYRRRRDQRHRRRRGPHLPPPALPVRPSGRTGIAAWAAAPERS